MTIDGHTVITGSFNFTTNAEARNAENLLIIRYTDLVSKYQENWTPHAQHSEPYERPAVPPKPEPPAKTNRDRWDVPRELPRIIRMGAKTYRS